MSRQELLWVVPPQTIDMAVDFRPFLFPTSDAKTAATEETKQGRRPTPCLYRRERIREKKSSVVFTRGVVCEPAGLMLQGEGSAVVQMDQRLHDWAYPLQLRGLRDDLVLITACAESYLYENYGERGGKPHESEIKRCRKRGL
jgi:hypothetical protein